MSATIHTPGGGRSLNGSHASLVVSINDVFYVTDAVENSAECTTDVSNRLCML
jgi:arylamine N-acetyltransferase